MVHKAKSKVIFAEADSDFVDILFSFMTLPLGTIVRVLGKCPNEKVEALPSLKNLYHSVTDLPNRYVSSEESKYLMLNPRSSSYDQCRKLKLNIDDTEVPKYFICPNLDCGRFSTCQLARCNGCGNIMKWKTDFIHSLAKTGGGLVEGGVFVSDVTTFIVTDDLHVMPNTSDFIIQLLRDHGINDANQLEERAFDIGREQILIFLKGALLPSLSLTYLVFPTTHLKRDLLNLGRGTLVKSLIGNEVDTNSKRMTLKVTLQKSTSKYLFAEAEEDFVEFVFCFLEIPLGTVIGKLMNGTTFLTSLDNLFASISNMEVGKYIKSQDLKDSLLKPELEHKFLSQNQIFPLNISKGCQLYRHSSFNSPYTADLVYITRSNSYFGHRNESLCSLSLNDPRVKGIFLKAPGKFMLTDDLVINPLSSFSTILNDVEQHELSIGIEEGLKILEATLNSSVKCLSTLTDVLLKGSGSK